MRFRALVLMLSLVRLSAAEDPAAAILADLEAADAARSQAAAEAADWEHERQRLELLLATLEQERATLAAEHARLAAASAELRERLGEPAAVAENIAALEQRMDVLATTIRDGLTAARRDLPPGVVPAVAADASGAIALTEAVAALRAAEQAVTGTEVAIVTARRDGQDLAVKLLRVGGAALWWRELDGHAAGPAQVVDGRVHCHPAADDAAAEAIRRAIAIREGLQAAELVRLPVHPQRGSAAP